MPTTNLYKKLYDIMCDTKAIDKDMTIEFKSTKYSAISESNILNEIKPLLKKHKVITMPIDIVMTQSGTLTSMVVKWKIVDIESGEFEIISSPGNGSDSQDKGSGKAFTYSYKALWQKMFMLFSGEDTDNVHSETLTEQIQTAKRDETKLKKVVELFDQMDEKFQQAVLKGYKIKDIERLPVGKYDDAINAMVKKLDSV